MNGNEQNVNMGVGVSATPQAPVEPVAPQAPVEPVAPQAPVEPVAPQAPVEPVAPQAPVEPVAPQAPVEPAPKKKKNVGFIIFIIFMLAIIGVFLYFTLFHHLDLNKDKKKEETSEVEQPVLQSPYHMTDNSVQTFDLEFLKLHLDKENKVYSPLAIKYALEMLAEGANGETKAQLDAVIGEYVAKKYTNSENLSFANALFVKESFKDSIKSTYVDTLKNKYNAEVVYDSFQSPTPLNDWVSEKTFQLIKNIVSDLSTNDFVLANALAVDMEWEKLIQAYDLADTYSVHYPHENYYSYVAPIRNVGYSRIDFEGVEEKVKGLRIGASVNKYDIVTTLGEENIRNEVRAAYQEYISKPNVCVDEYDVEKYLDQYMNELNSGYKSVDSSTDFSFLDNDVIKVFAKNLKTYNNTSLQYVGIMPKEGTLEEYIQNLNSEKLKNTISQLKTITYDNFEEGVITKIVGDIPLFELEYELDLKNDLLKMGIEDAFDITKSDFSNLISDGKEVIEPTHKANFAFSNEGIKAGASVTLGSAGDATCGFVYDFEVPVKEIDLTFDRPYLFILRDVNSGEIWFMGTVYEPNTSATETGYGNH